MLEYTIIDFHISSGLQGLVPGPSRLGCPTPQALPSASLEEIISAVESECNRLGIWKADQTGFFLLAGPRVLEADWVQSSSAPAEAIAP